MSAVAVLMTERWVFIRNKSGFPTYRRVWVILYCRVKVDLVLRFSILTLFSLKTWDSSWFAMTFLMIFGFKTRPNYIINRKYAQFHNTWNEANLEIRSFLVSVQAGKEGKVTFCLEKRKKNSFAILALHFITIDLCDLSMLLLNCIGGIECYRFTTVLR